MLTTCECGISMQPKSLENHIYTDRHNKRMAYKRVISDLEEMDKYMNGLDNINHLLDVNYLLHTSFQYTEKGDYIIGSIIGRSTEWTNNIFHRYTMISDIYQYSNNTSSIVLRI